MHDYCPHVASLLHCTNNDFLGCAKCGLSSKGQLSCCGKGGSWQGKCGPPGNAKFEHTWNDGFEACATVSQSTTPETVFPSTTPETGKSPLSKLDCCHALSPMTENGLGLFANIL